MKNQAKWIASSILISIISIVLVLILTMNSKTIEIAREIRPGYILAALFIHLFSFFIWGLRIRSMASALGHKIDLKTSAEMVISGTFVAALTPASIGGEPLRIHLLRQRKMPVGQATAVILGERVLDALLILLAVPFSLYLLHGLLSNSSLDIVIILGEFLSIIIFALMIYATMKPRYIKLAIHRLVEWTARLLGKKTGDKLHKLSKSIDREIDEFHASINIFLTEGRAGLYSGLIYTVIYWIVEFSSLPVILMGLNQAPSILISFAAQVLLMIVIVIPSTPGASGVAELAAISLFSVFVPANILGITVAGWRGITFYTNIIAGGFVSFKLLKDTELVKKYLNQSQSEV
ncbi:lysylphosphatidylglycerol synthase transmembrane domain-containing protein [Methanosarcina sp. UBA5]|uniref:lysylphosphatidylglycerol synthase transmembrane domain-containing protein n=1 Tax=Methanosarcina sp. UBA5 TaxID=1915593 RepID=UPI0025CC0A81|nr:flippase-like domain-containing protein [Methanosarcina sp. UBA5]